MPLERQVSVEVASVLVSFPYFVLRDEITTGYSSYVKELVEIKQNYVDYKKGAEFYTEGSSGDYQPSAIRFKISKTLIDKEARFMFSQTPDVILQSSGTDEEQSKQVEQYQNMVDKVLEKSMFSSNLLKGAKDCFIGKRIACLVDYSEDYGIKVHFYNSLQFYYETDYDSDRLTKFISFENINETKSMRDRKYLVNRYEDINGKIHFKSTLYDGAGNILEYVIEETELELKYIPAVVITNDGTLDDKRGVSEIEGLLEYESGYSRLANADIDSERKGMNPVRYVVDMNTETTKNLSSGAGAFWEMKSEQNQNEVHTMVGTLAPQMNHTESVKTTLERIRSAMFANVDVPDVTQEGLLSGITSFKALKALYYPLTVRSNEKLMTWLPSLKFVVQAIIDLAMLNKDNVISMYTLTGLDEVQFNIEIIENYALLDDEAEEKEIDLAEIAQKTRSRKSYIKKWRKSEFKTDEQIEEELMQIAIEENMFDTMSMNTQVQTEINRRSTEEQTEQNIDDITIQQKLNE